MGWGTGNNTGQFGFSNGSTVTKAFTGGVTAGSMLVLTMSWSGAADAAMNTPTDTQGNTYTLSKKEAYSGNTNAGVYAWTAIAGSTGANSVTVSGPSGSYTSCYGEEFTGPAATPLDQTNGNLSGVAGSSATPGSVTPGQGGELVVAVYGQLNSVQTFSPPSGYTAMANQPSGSANQGVWSGYKIKSAGDAAAENPALGLSPNDQWAACIATYKAAATARGLFSPANLSTGAGGPFFVSPNA